MKRLLIFIALLSILVSCKKTSYVAKFDKTPQERAADQISLVSTTLTGATNGWIATLPTRAGGGYAFYLTFDNQQNVTMYGDLNDASATTFAKSYYRVKQDIGTDLVFDSYSYLAMLNDPNGAVLGGQDKIGYQSDVDFTYDHVTADSIIFIGKKYRQPFKLVKATAAQKALFDANGYKAAIDKFKAFFTETKYPYIEMVTAGVTIKVGVNVNLTNNLSTGKRASFTGVLSDGKTIGVGNEKIALTLDGASILNAGLTYADVKFVKFSWKDATTLAVYDNTGKEYIIKSSANSVTPLHLLIGTSYGTVTLPNATTYPGWGADYVARRATSTTAMLNGGYALRLEQMAFSFNNVTKKMTLRVNMPQNSTQYVGTINYTYTKTDAGVYKFNYVDADGNGALCVNFMAPLLGQRLHVDTFTVDYLVNPTTGALMAQFTSIQNPTFSFAGPI